MGLIFLKYVSDAFEEQHRLRTGGGRGGPDEYRAANKIYQPLKWSAELGVEAKKKTRTVLNRLWLDPRAELVDFADRSATLKTQPEIPIAALC